MRIVVTGGAGFIGSHVADELLRHGHTVRVLDSLDEQVHPDRQRPDYLDPDVELQVGDVRDPEAVARAVDGVEAVIHLAAKVGVGQSMYEVRGYVDVNDLGTATLLQTLIGSDVRRLLVASSMSIYGEGLMLDGDGKRVETVERTVEQLRRGQWEPCGVDGEPLQPVPTPEDKRPALTSVYALGKFAQERMGLITGRAFGIPTTALRFFNVYGPRQALSNPYTGVLAIFAARLLNGQPPSGFRGRGTTAGFRARARRRPRLPARPRNQRRRRQRDQHRERRQHRHRRDRREADRGAGHERHPSAHHRAVSRRRHPSLLRRHVAGARRLGFHARVPFDEGLLELVEWLAGRQATDRSAQAMQELTRRGLVA